jgi:hypothetical protein
MEQNTFLKNFIKMRENLKESKTTKTDSLKSIAKPKTDLSIDSLIKDKPPQKVVEEYFKNRIIELFKD